MKQPLWYKGKQVLSSVAVHGGQEVARQPSNFPMSALCWAGIGSMHVYVYVCVNVHTPALLILLNPEKSK